jgi:hypothetical protein
VKAWVKQAQSVTAKQKLRNLVSPGVYLTRRTKTLNITRKIHQPGGYISQEDASAKRMHQPRGCITQKDTSAKRIHQPRGYISQEDTSAKRIHQPRGYITRRIQTRNLEAYYDLTTVPRTATLTPFDHCTQDGHHCAQDGHPFIN